MAESRARTSDTAEKKPVRTPRTRKKEISAAGIAERAYAISQSESGGSPEENWLRAEQELLAGAAR
jgi:hypothetical protein